jgi:hypothetical protein
VADIPQTNIVLGPGGQAHAVANATQTMAHSLGLAQASATKTQGGMQPVNTAATVQMIVAIVKAG